MGYETILFEKRDGIAYITLNRPERANAINGRLGADVALAMDEVEDDPSCRVVILTGAGRHFCGGADLRDAAGLLGGGSRQAIDGPAPRRDMFTGLEQSRVPVIAAINGAAMGGGCEIALACDMRIMSTTASIGQPEIRFGALPLAGGTQRLPRLVGPGKAKELIFTGLPITANEALRIGLVNATAEPDELIPKCEELARVLIERAGFALKTAKQLINLALDTELSDGLKLERELIGKMATPEERAEAQQRAAASQATYGRIFGGSSEAKK
jgi:enoyl-CoA hydratase/carnithine racemase